MIHRIVKLTFDPDFISIFRETFFIKKPDILDFPGCNSVELYIELDQSGVAFTVSVWETVEDLANYRSSGFFKNTWKKLKPHFTASPEAWSTSKLT